MVYEIDNLLTAAILVFSAILTLIAYGAHRRSGNRRLLWVAAAFAVLFIKAAVRTIGLFSFAGLDIVENPLFDPTFDLLMLAMLFASTLQRPTAPRATGTMAV